ncbi:PKD domain-containing protein [Halomicroarcula sp. GCM10025709]|uniref:PKD domain-containing protein n=1 Tax=Haloarcula TaxID=2237 RepID=UPI0024C436BB|nr:PKD domain-containing protein [Halomicroarcula sp. YJ-61-S]
MDIGAGKNITKNELQQSDEADFAPPQIVDERRVDMQTVQLDIDDNMDVDESSINQNDFQVSPGRVVGVTAEDDGTDAEVDVFIEDAGNTAVTISTTNETEISDTNGNEFTGEYNAVVEAPADPPQIQDASWADATRVEQYEGSIEWPDQKPGETTILEVYLTDGTGIDTATVDKDDFVVNRGRVVDTATRTDGENAYVLLVLSKNLNDGALDNGSLTVRLYENATIRDTEGRIGNRIVRPGPMFVLSNTGPTFAGARRINDTSVALSFTDDTNVAESSIQENEIQIAGADLPATEVSDFEAKNVDLDTLRTYPISGLNTTENGSNATAIVRMGSPVNDEELLVRVKPSATIVDTIGNTYKPGMNNVTNRYVVDGMDGIPPEVDSFSAVRTNKGTTAVSLTASERLSQIDISVQGATSDTLNMSDFSLNKESSFTYATTYSHSSNGTLVFKPNSITDDSGNTYSPDLTAVSNGTTKKPPTPVISIDFEISENQTYVFDARHSSSKNPIANYTWQFADGTTAHGMRVQRSLSPGTHLVALTVTDNTGQSATETATLDLPNQSVENITPDQMDNIRRVTDPDTRVTQTQDTSETSSRIQVNNPSPGKEVRIRPQDSVLAANNNLSIDSMGVVTSRYDDFSLQVATTDPQVVTDLSDSSDRKIVGGFSVEHDVPESAFQQATLSAGVSTQRIRDLGAAPSDVTVLRQKGNTWEQIPTSPVPSASNTGDMARFRLTSPGFSQFAIAVTNATQESNDTSETSSSRPNDNLSVGDRVKVQHATINKTSVVAGSSVLIESTIKNPSDSTAEFVAGLSINNSTTDTKRVEIPAGGQESVMFVYAFDQTGNKVVGINDTTAGKVTVENQQSRVGKLANSVATVLPLGILRSILLALVALIIISYAILKSLAIYFGY